MQITLSGPGENGVDSSAPSPNSENDSSITEPPDAESEDEFYKFSDAIHSLVNVSAPKALLNPAEADVIIAR